VLLGEHLLGDAIAVERTGCSGVGLDVDECLDDLVGRDSVVERDADLSAKWFECPEGGRDRDGDQRSGRGVEGFGAGPGISEGVRGGEAFEVCGRGGSSGAASRNGSSLVPRRSAAVWSAEA
jgi:hypothetical protein